MYTTLGYEAQKAIIEERVRNAALARQQSRMARQAMVRGSSGRLRHGRHGRVRGLVGLLASRV